MKKLFINGEWVIVKINPLTMAKSEVMIIVPKRVGQNVTWQNVPGNFDHCGTLKSGAAYCVTTIVNAEYGNSELNVLFDIQTRERLYWKSINLDSHRASYELLRAFS